MTREEKIEPLGYFYYYPIDVDIQIRSHDKSIYDVVIRLPGRRRMPFQITVTDHDIATIHVELQQAIEKVVTESGKNGIRNQVLRGLATAGKSAFEVIFGNHIAR